MKAFTFRSLAASAAIGTTLSLFGAQTGMAAGFFNNQFLQIFANAFTTVSHTQSIGSSSTTASSQVTGGGFANQTFFGGGSATAVGTSTVNVSATNTTTVFQN